MRTTPEILEGSAGYFVHAFDASGNEPLGWPKFTGGWNVANPAVGDVDGDGLNEVVVLTREGYLYVWNTGAPSGAEEWPKKRHDLRNTGNYEEPAGQVANPPQPTPTSSATATPGGPTPTATPTPTLVVPTATATDAPACLPAPRTGCRRPVQAAKASILLKDRTPDTKDSLLWKWTKGASTSKSDFGQPTTTTGYDLCVYDGPRGLVLHASIPADGSCNGRPCWTENRSGFRFKDNAGTPDGITRVTLKEGVEPGRAKILIKGKGANLDLPALPMTQPVTVQLSNSLGVCWEAVYGPPAQRNEAEQYKDKSD